MKKGSKIKKLREKEKCEPKREGKKFESSQDWRARARKFTKNFKTEGFGRRKRGRTGTGEREKNLNVKQAHENIIILADKRTVGFR